MNLFYAPGLDKKATSYVFDKDESRHISKVLRKKTGDTLFLTNGKGLLFTAVITDDNPKKTGVKIEKATTKSPKNYHVHVAMAPTKSNDRMAFFLEKATEMGMDRFTPVITKYSERKTINHSRYEKVVTAAMKQSLQFYKPQISEATAFEKFLSQDFTGYKKLIAYCNAAKPVLESFSKNENLLLLVGPEGGFDQSEIDQALAVGFTPVLLSNNRLRTETAGLTGVMAVALKNL